MAAVEPGAVPDTTTEIPQGEVPDFANVREAQAWARENADLSVIDTPDPDAPVEPAPTGDEFDDVVPARPEGTTPAAPSTQPAPGSPVDADPYQEFGRYNEHGQWEPGSKETVTDAVTIANALRTEGGVRAVVAQGLAALGYTGPEIQAFLQRQAAAQAAGADPSVGLPADPLANITDDDVVTGGEVKQIVQAAVQSAVQQITQAQQEAVKPLEQQIAEDRSRNAQQAVDSTLVQLLGIENNTPTEVQKEQIQDIQLYASRYLDPNVWDPNQIRQAVVRGHADMVARDQRRVEAYVAQKRAARDAQPAHIGGGTPPGGDEVQEPKSVKEAIAMRKAMGIV